MTPQEVGRLEYPCITEERNATTTVSVQRFDHEKAELKADAWIL